MITHPLRTVARALLFLAILPIQAKEEGPFWIWPVEDRHGAGKAEFAKNIAPPTDGIDKAALRITSDFSHLEIFINGKSAAGLEPFDPPLDLDLRPFLIAGENQILIQAEGIEGPSAMAARIAWSRVDGGTVTIDSDPSWISGSQTGPPELGRISRSRWAPNELPEISPFAEYNQWKEAKPGTKARLSPLPPGFTIEKLRSAGEDEDSWVSMVFDDRGRIIIAREHKGLLRLTLPNSPGEEFAVEVIDDTLEECRGLLWKDGQLFANANDSRGLYRLRDTDGDDQFDEVTLLRHTEGKTGHGRNDLALGPDGKIHAIQGDVVLVPAGSTWKTVPENEAPKELGHQVSTDTEGNGWLIHNRGLRNPYGIDFNSDGEAFTYDADNEGDVGLPFYRPTRINHLVSGANYGWHQLRGNSRNMTVYAPDSVPTTFDTGRGSPTAVKFGLRSNFPSPYRDSLFALDWAYGRIISVNLVPRGASYYGSGGIFLEGRPLNVTDLDFDETGDLYFVTGGRKTQSALYRIRFTGTPDPPESLTPQEAARIQFSEQSRDRRRALEQRHGKSGRPGFEAVWKALGDTDPWIRNAARVALESQPLAGWKARALQETEPDLRGLTALLALVRQDTDANAIAERVSMFDANKWKRSEKLAALRIYEIGGSEVTVPLRESIEQQVSTWIDSSSAPVRLEVVRILVMIESPLAIPAAIDLESRAGGQLERLHFLEMLSDAATGWTPETRQSYFRRLGQAKKFSIGDRFMPEFFATLEKNALAHVPDQSEREELSALLVTNDTKVFETPARSFVKAWTTDDFAALDDLGDRNLERGGALFESVLCSRCHVHGSVGIPVGPDLTRVANRFSRRDLIDSIVNPSRVVAEVHRNLVIRKNDGETVVGRIVGHDFRESILSVSQNPFNPGELIEIPKSAIASYEESPVSPMPPGLLNTLNREEVLDLIAWLESDGQE